MGLLGEDINYYGVQPSSNFPQGAKGDYQFTTMDNIISAFMITHVGESKILSKVDRTEVQFHAMRAIQELSYDVFRSMKSHEMEVPPTLKMPLPHDYVNYVKVVRPDKNGIERILYPTGKTSNPFPILQFTTGQVLNAAGNDMVGTYAEGGDGYPSEQGLTTGSSGISIASDAGQTITLKYISDGLGTDAEMTVHKFCEEACYKWIACGLLSTRSNIPPYIMQRFKKEKFAETRKAKIRLSNIKIEEFTQVLKGLSKPIK